MADVFISYAHAEAAIADRVAEALRAVGHAVWRDDQLPVHRAYSDVIEERLRAADAVLVLWSAQAAKSQWVRAEAEVAREAGKLVQAGLDGVMPPLPFNQIQCADLAAWAGERDHPGWGKVLASLATLVTPGAEPASPGRPSAPIVAPAPDERPSIAVLPLQYLAGGPEEACFADGMADEIVGALSRFSTLTVIGSGSSLSYRGDRRPPAQIAAELGARFLLAGSIRRSADRVRVSVSLTDAKAGRQLWAERFDGSLEDVFALQEQIGVAAAAQITPAIEMSYARRAIARPTSDLSAYELYLRAAHREREFTRAAFEDGIASLNLAIERDPNFTIALAYASLMHSLLLLNGWADDPAATSQTALGLGRRALATGADDHEAFALVSTVLIWVGGDAATADALVERALALNPGASTPWFASAWIKLVTGRHQLALEHWDRHLALDPRSPLYAFVAGGRGVAFTLEGRFEEGAGRLAEALHHVPDHRPFATFHAAALGLAGRPADARASLDRLPADAVENALGLLRDPADRVLIAQGLSLATRDLEAR
jgi:adenylate cyclase